MTSLLYDPDVQALLVTIFILFLLYCFHSWIKGRDNWKSIFGLFLISISIQDAILTPIAGLPGLLALFTFFILGVLLWFFFGRPVEKKKKKKKERV